MLQIRTELSNGSFCIVANVLQIGDVADFGTLNFLQPLNIELKTELNINREPRHIAYVLLWCVFL